MKTISVLELALCLALSTGCDKGQGKGGKEAPVREPSAGPSDEMMAATPDDMTAMAAGETMAPPEAMGATTSGPGDALYNQGLAAARAGDHGRAAELWENAVAADPKNVDALYNLGQHHQLRGDAAAQLRFFLAAHQLAPRDVEILKKVVQSHYRLSQLDQAAPFKQQLVGIVKASPDPKVASMKEFCIDQFTVDAGTFFVYETIEPKGDLHYLLRFRLMAGNKMIRSINVESSAVLKERGLVAVLGQHQDGRHSTFRVGWKVLPPYPELKKIVLEAHAGKLPVGASLSPR